MVEGLEIIVDFLTSLVNFIVSLVQDLIFIVQTLAMTVVHLPDYLGWLPSSVLATVLVTFAVVVIYKVLGREG